MKITDHKAFHNRFVPSVRMEYIGGTDTAAILNMHPFKKRYEVWLEKLGKIDPVDLTGNEAVYWG